MKKIVFAFVIFVVFTLVGSTPANAISVIQKEIFNNEILYYDKDIGCDPSTNCVCGNGNSASLLTGSDNEEKTWNYFIGKGLNKFQVAGIMGNISRESSFNPLKIQNPGGETQDPSNISSGWGLIQWTPGRKILNIAKQAKITTPIYLLETQLDIIWWHMNVVSPTGVRNMIAQFDTNDEKEATEIFERLVEGAGVPALEDRQARASAILQKYGSATATISTTTSPISGTCTTNVSVGEDGVVTSDGYSLPVRKSGVNLPCRNTTCHHDRTPAADLFRPDGDPVYAITAGKIQNLHYRAGFGKNGPAPQECKSFQLIGDDGWAYWYGHIKNVNVNNGDRVTAGQQIAQVGPSRCADDTPPHLHIDRGSPQGRLGGSQCCRDPGFIPLLNKIYEDTPD